MSAIQISGRVVMAGRSSYKSGEMAVLVIIKPRNDLPTRVHALLPTRLYGQAGVALVDRIVRVLRDAGHVRLMGSGMRPLCDTLDIQLLDAVCLSPSGAADVVAEHRDRPVEVAA